MRWVVVSCLVVAACGRENFDDTQDTGGGGMVDLNDNDQDGIINSSDNCPVHYNATQSDLDGDRIGDACDPRPGVAGDRVIAIGPFGSDFGGWVPDTASNWVINQGAAHTTSTDIDNTQARMSVTANAKQPTVQLGFVIEDYGTLDASIGMIRIAGSSDLWECYVYGQTSLINAIRLDRGGNNTANSPIASVAQGTAVTMSMTLGDSMTTCFGNGTPASGVAAAGASSYTATIEVRGFKAAFTYAAMYDIP